MAWLLDTNVLSELRLFSQPDLMFAATALHHGFTVVTRDRSEYDKVLVPVVNPWEGS
jgi:predicted nucleic acid-binding protein